MVYPEGGGFLYQATPDAILQHPDHPLYLLIGIAISNSDVVVYNP